MQAGDEVPEFRAPDQSGREVTLTELLADGPLVVFFYPKAMTAGCTKESCHFRDLRGEFDAAGATVVGVSADPVDRQAAFDEAHGLGFTLLSDPDRTIAGHFGVSRGFPLGNKRETFVIGPDRRVIRRIASGLNMNVHADDALAALRRS